MDSINSLIECVIRERDLDKLRLAIANAIAARLVDSRGSFGYWQKVHFAQAIAALAWNVSISGEQATSWLRFCLASLELASTPKEKRFEDYTPRREQMEALTFEDLVADIRTLGGRI